MFCSANSNISCSDCTLSHFHQNVKTFDQYKNSWGKVYLIKERMKLGQLRPP